MNSRFVSIEPGDTAFIVPGYRGSVECEIESRMIVTKRVSQAPNDKQELVPSLAITFEALQNVVWRNNNFLKNAVV